MTNTDLGGASGGPRPDSTGAGDASPKDMAKAAVQTVKQEAASFASTAQDKVGEKVEQTKETASQTMGDFADAIRKAGDDLSQHDRSMAGRMVKQAADGLESLSRSVSDKRPEELVDAVRDFGRHNPTAFIAGSVLLGLALGRFARSSEQHADQQDHDRQAAQGDGSYRSLSDFASQPELALNEGDIKGDIGAGMGGVGGAGEPRADGLYRPRFDPEA